MCGYKIGECILRNHPLAYVVEKHRRAEVCEYCFRSDITVKRCAKCKHASYCSPDCQKKAWKEAHKFECEGLLRSEGKMSSFMQLVAQTVLKLKLGIDGEDPKRNTTPFQRKFYDLASHWSEAKMDQEISVYVKDLSKSISEYFANAEFDKLLEYDALGEIYSRIKSNAYAIQGSMNEPVGHGLFLSAGKFDHSCKPNASQSYDGPDMLVHAITDINTLDEVRVTYTELNQPAVIRQRFLKKHYFFDCNCEWCNDPVHDGLMYSVICQKKLCGEAVPFRAQKPGPYKCLACGSKVPKQAIIDAEEVISKAETVAQKIEKQMAEGEFTSALQLAQPILRRAAGLLHPKNFVVCTFSLLCSSAYTSIGDFNSAFTFSQNALEGTTFAYPPKHIAVGSHLLQLIKLGLQLHLSDKSLFDDLELLARSAMDITKIAAGENSSVHRKAQELYAELLTAAKSAHSSDHGCCSGHHHH